MNGKTQFKFELGHATYFGDLSNATIDFRHYSYPRLRPSVKAGISNYVTNYLVISANIFYTNLKGDDDPTSNWSNGRGPGYDRGLRFSTHLVGVESFVSLPLFPKKRAFTFMKSIGLEPKLGVAFFNYTPTNKVDGVRYNLRKVGTYGQHIFNDINNYSRFTAAIPLGISLVYNYNYFLKITVNYTAYKLFTDYLDDVSNDQFITKNIIEANGLEVGEEFMQLANPNNKSGYRSNTKRYDYFTTLNVGLNFELFKNKLYNGW
jgi:hypothetical protein